VRSEVISTFPPRLALVPPDSFAIALNRRHMKVSPRSQAPPLRVCHDESVSRRPELTVHGQRSHHLFHPHSARDRCARRPGRIFGCGFSCGRLRRVRGTALLTPAPLRIAKSAAPQRVRDRCIAKFYYASLAITCILSNRSLISMRWQFYRERGDFFGLVRQFALGSSSYEISVRDQANHTDSVPG